MKNFDLEIERLNPILDSRGLATELETLNSLEDITDINEVRMIIIKFGPNAQLAKDTLSLFPKNCKGYICNVRELNQPLTHHIKFFFNTFNMNKKTGEINETAVNNRIKVINKIKELSK